MKTKLKLKPTILQGIEMNTDSEVRTLDSMCISLDEEEDFGRHLLKYLFFGIFFGVILVKAEVVSWFRIQEMFRLQSFHMYGIIGSAVLTGGLSVWLIRKFQVKTIYGKNIAFHPRAFHKGHVYGGLIFGLGWAMTGCCPGPMYALIGSGASVMFIVLLSAISGTWVFGLMKDRLPF
jgi:hypothetical protein